MRIRFAGKERQLARVAIDFPKQGERVTSTHYAVRLSAPAGAGAVEVSIDFGRWAACREWAGHWWFDWSGYPSGAHKVLARVKTPEGEVVSGEAHEVYVELEPAPAPLQPN